VSARRLAKAAAGLLLRVALRASARKTGVALLYHSVEPSGRRREDELVPPTPPELCARQLDHLRRCYRVVPASRLQVAAAERRRGGKLPVAITFDDDDRGYRERVLPALRTAGLTATFFLNRAGSRPLWWRQLQAAWDADAVDAELVAAAGASDASLEAVGHAVSRMRPAGREPVEVMLRERAGEDESLLGLEDEDVQALAQAGFEIGFHTTGHYFLPALDDGELREALRAGAPLEGLAYPNGGHDERVRAAVAEAGFSHAFTASPAPVTPESDPLALGRVTPPRGNVAELSLEITRTAAGRPRGR